jgi:hypothetical protein
MNYGRRLKPINLPQDILYSFEIKFFIKSLINFFVNLINSSKMKKLNSIYLILYEFQIKINILLIKNQALKIFGFGMFGI